MDVLKSKDILSHIREHGYTGSESLFRMYLSKLRKSQINNNNEIDKNQKLIKREKVFKLFWKSYDELTERNHLILNDIIESSVLLSEICQSVQSFRQIIRSKDSESLSRWISDNINSEIIQIKKFAQSLKKDIKAISNTLKYEYTNAILGGHVNKLKTVKRMMYGRANFDFLRQRVLFNS